MVIEPRSSTESFLSSATVRTDALSAARAGDRQTAREVLADFCDRGTRGQVIEPDVLAYIGECLWTGMRRLAQIRQQAAKARRGIDFSFHVAFHLRPALPGRPPRQAPSLRRPCLPPNMGRWMYDLRARIHNSRSQGPAAGMPAYDLIEFFCACADQGLQVDSDVVAFIARGLRPLVSPLRGDAVKRLRLMARRAGRPAKVRTERPSRAAPCLPKRPPPATPLRVTTNTNLDRMRPYATVHGVPGAKPRTPRQNPVYEQDGTWFDEEGRWIAFPEC